MNTILIERYGYLGGMGAGGLVTIIPCLSDFSGRMQLVYHKSGRQRSRM